jgi:hypothetical protein
LLADLELILGRPPVDRPPTEGEIPPTGIAVDDLPDLWGCTAGEALARLARMEMAGQVLRAGDVVLPGG